ncbi:hypothetical protein MTBBW1_80051 [Desulfamplus magnetovallimortis]|uniref:Uncharacterized protein n=1 Tax=Desulfamplus magnetovallimortis TaxID=1246637 RepID=L0R532_9BACT|nr:hypothetical protein DEMABW1_80051 [Desulfamplus magnetovallimortis BW-1]SLM32713.1 hypothetical protein MTBBW1_80051 [Desulfamplus magnetovallimortis]
MQHQKLTGRFKEEKGERYIIINSHQPVMIRDKGKFLVKIVLVSYLEQESWLGCMRGKGKITGDIISPAEDTDNWKVLSE